MYAFRYVYWAYVSNWYESESKDGPFNLSFIILGVPNIYNFFKIQKKCLFICTSDFYHRSILILRYRFSSFINYSFRNFWIKKKKNYTCFNLKGKCIQMIIVGFIYNILTLYNTSTYLEQETRIPIITNRIIIEMFIEFSFSCFVQTDRFVL